MPKPKKPAAPPALKVERVRVDSIFPNPANAKRHPPEQIEKLKASLARFGQQRPLIVSDDVVRCGNGTYAAIVALGWTHVEIIRTELTGADLVAFEIADNRLAELGEFDLPVLSKTLKGLGDEGYDLELTGFTPPELDAFLKADFTAEPGTATGTPGEGSPEGEQAQYTHTDLSTSQGEPGIPPADPGDDYTKADPIIVTPNQREVIARGFEKMREELGEQGPITAEGRLLELLIADWLSGH